jgi:hypothetical protein
MNHHNERNPKIRSIRPKSIQAVYKSRFLKSSLPLSPTLNGGEEVFSERTKKHVYNEDEVKVILSL